MPEPVPVYFMKETKWIYGTQAWKKCRNSYVKSVGGLCEDCLQRGLIVPGDEVHHKIFITPNNMNNPQIVFNPENLILLCKDCHARRHMARHHRYKVDDCGKIIAIDSPPF